MQSIKKKVIKAIENLEDDVDYEKIMETIYVQQKINKGFDQIDKGHYITHEKMRERMKKWLE